MGNYFGRNNERFTLVDVDAVLFPNPGDELFIREPENFAIQRFKLTRDKKYKGFNSEASDGELTLIFDKNTFTGTEAYSPFSFILECLDIGGYDINLKFRAYRTPQGGSEEYKEWKIESYEQLDYGFSCRLKRVRFNDQLRSRMDTSVSLESSEDLNGNSNSPISSMVLPLHARALLEEYEADYVTTTSPQSVTLTEDFLIERGTIGSGGYMNIGWRNIIKNDLGVTDQESVVWHTEAELQEIFTSQYEGIYTFNVKLSSADGFINPNVGFDNPTSVILRITDNNGVNNDNIFSKSTVTDPVFGATSATYTLNQTVNIKPGDKAYLYWYNASDEPFLHTALSESGGVIIRGDYFIISALTYSEPYVVEGNFIFDCLNKVTQKVTGGTGVLIESSLIEKIEDGAATDGDGALNFITTGNKLRRLDNPFLASFRTLIDFLQVRYNAGFSVIEQGGGVEKIIIEESDYFFQDSEILRIDSYENIMISYVTDFAYNEIELGYSNFSDPKEKGTKQGFNTIRGYLLPVKGKRNKLSLVAEAVTDDMEIERVRRINKQNKESDKSDENVFIIKCQRFNSSNPILHGTPATIDRANPLRQKVIFDPTNKKITLQGYYLEGQTETATTLYIGVDTLLIPLTVDTYTINSISYDVVNNQTVIITNEALTDTGTYSTNYKFYFDIDIFLPERIEEVYDVSGIQDEFSVYNIEHSPTNILKKHFNFIGSSINQKVDSEEIKITSRKNNTDLERKGSELSGNDVIKENQNFTLLALRGYNPTYLNNKKYEISCNLDYDDELKVILDALSDTNLGYITSVDIEGNEFKMYPTEIEYDATNKDTKIIGWGKK